MENSRTKNFSSEEIEILMSLIRQHAHILENKTTDKVRPAQKEKEWEKLEESFNAMCPGQKRSARALRTKYANLKGEMRKRSAQTKRSLYETGGGPPLKTQNLECDIVDQALKEILPENQIDGLKSSYDCDVLDYDIFGIYKNPNCE